MIITTKIFEAFLKCPTKCWLRAAGEPPTGNTYAEWVEAQAESCRATETDRLLNQTPASDVALSPPNETLKTARWRLAVGVPVQRPDRSADSFVRESLPNEEAGGLGGPRSEPFLESRLHAVERIPSEGRGKAAQFIPIRFIFRNKLTTDDKLLLAFDALVLSEMLGRAVSLGKIIHGDDHATLKGKTAALAGEVRKRLEKITTLLSNPTPPDLVLNRHCAECEFQAR